MAGRRTGRANVERRCAILRSLTAEEIMRWSIAAMAVISLAAGWGGPPAASQQIQQAPLPPVAPSPQTAPQMAQSPQRDMTTTRMNTQDCVELPTPEQQTDCLNKAASQGDYMPTKPAPG